MNRQPRTRYDLLCPDATLLKQQVKPFEQNAATPVYSVGDVVYALNFGSHGSKWVPDITVSIISLMNYRVQVDELTYKRHRNQLRARSIPDVMIPDVRPPPEVLPVLGNLPESRAISSLMQPAEMSPVPEPSASSSVVETTASPVPGVIPWSVGINRQRRTVQKPLRYRD